MSDQPLQNVAERFKQVIRLDRNGRANADKSTRASIRGIIGPQPTMAGFDWRAVDWGALLPQVAIYLILFAIGIIGFWISAGKQLMAGGLLFKPLSTDPQYAQYVQDGPRLLLIFGEINAVFFMGVATSLPPHMVGFGKHKFNFSAVACYVWAVVCAGIAIVSNVTISLQHQSELSSVSVLATLETLAPPLAALFVGWVGERLWHQWASARKAAKQSRVTAYENWRRWSENPETHPQWDKRLQDAILAELYKYPGNKELLENDRPLRAFAYSVELTEMRDKLEVVDVMSVLSNPTPPPSEVNRDSAGGSTLTDLSMNSAAPTNYSNVSQTEAHVAG